MTGLGLIIPRSTGPGPVIPDDIRLGAGSLLLVDPAHSVNPWPAGAPAHGARLPNLAAAEAAALGIVGDTGAPFSNTLPNGSVGVVERSAKGGLHVIMTAANVVANGQGVNLGIPANVVQYIFDHLDHQFFVSWWGALTRARAGTIPGTQQSPYLQIGNNGQGGNNYFVRWWEGATRPDVAPRRIGYRGVENPNVAGSKHVNQGITGYNGSEIPAGTAAVRTMLRLGRPTSDATETGTGATESGMSEAGAPSRLFYGAYIEDLTVSGRTYAEADALDMQAHNLAFGPGGRYANDTYTDPATVA